MAGRDGNGDETNGTAETHWRDGVEDTTGPMATEPDAARAAGSEEDLPEQPPPGTPGQGGTTAVTEDGDGTAMRTPATPS